MTRTDVATREVMAPPTEVYAALIDPETLVQWLPPDGMSGEMERFDAWPGGGYRLVLRYDDPIEAPGKTGEGSDVVEVRFVELVPGEAVVETVDFVSDDPAYGGTMTMSWRLTPRPGGGCLVELRADDVPGGISQAEHLAGMSDSLRNLAAFLTD
jgi:uncharacterized protein YndB with AHSA1/START domain